MDSLWPLRSLDWLSIGVMNIWKPIIEGGAKAPLSSICGFEQ